MTSPFQKIRDGLNTNDDFVVNLFRILHASYLKTGMINMKDALSQAKQQAGTDDIAFQDYKNKLIWGAYSKEAAALCFSLDNQLVDKLDHYIKRIKKHKIGDAIDFEYGFKLFGLIPILAKSRARSREANYELAKKLKKELKAKHKSTKDTLSIFSNDNIGKLRPSSINNKSVRGINSSELYAIIKLANKSG